MAKFCILGSGIAGLSTAYYLKKNNPSSTIIILEEQHKAGGVIDSDPFGDCVVEWGPRGIRPKGNGQFVLEMAEDLGLWDELVFADDKSKKRYLYHDNKLQVLPYSFTSFIRSPYLFIFIKALFKDLKAKHVTQDETIADFVDRHFGEDVRRLFFDSVVSGIWAGDVSQMSISATLPLLKRLEARKGSIVRALRSYKAPASEAKSYPKEVTSKALFSFKKGLQVLTDRLKDRFEGSIVYDASITAIDFDKTTVHCANGTVYEYDTLVSTIPAFKLSPFVSNDLATTLNSIQYSPVAVLNMQIPKGQINFDGFGFLVPSKEKSVVLGMVANSNTFPSHGSKTHIVNTVMLGGARFTYNQLALMDLENEAKAFLSKVFGKDVVSVQQELRLIDNAIPQYELGHLSKVAAIEVHSSPNFKILGSYLYGVSIIDIVNKSKEYVDSIK